MCIADKKCASLGFTNFAYGHYNMQTGGTRPLTFGLVDIRLNPLTFSNDVGNIFVAHFGPITTSYLSRKCHSLPVYCCWPCTFVYGCNFLSSTDYLQLNSVDHVMTKSHFTSMADSELNGFQWPFQSANYNPVEYTFWVWYNRRFRAECGCANLDFMIQQYHRGTQSQINNYFNGPPPCIIVFLDNWIEDAYLCNMLVLEQQHLPNKAP